MMETRVLATLLEDLDVANHYIRITFEYIPYPKVGLRWLLTLLDDEVVNFRPLDAGKQDRRRLEALARVRIWVDHHDRTFNIMLPADFKNGEKKEKFIRKMAPFLEKVEVRTIRAK